MFGPRTISSTVTGREPTRLVNQLESGTSSIVLMFCAGRPEGSRLGSAKELRVNSYNMSCSLKAARDASCGAGS